MRRVFDVGICGSRRKRRPGTRLKDQNEEALSSIGVTGGQVSGKYGGGVIIMVFFSPKTHAQASMCELMRYHGGANSMIGFSTILCVFDKLL